MKNKNKNLIKWGIIIGATLLGVLIIIQNGRLTTISTIVGINTKARPEFELYEVKEETIRNTFAYNVGDPAQCSGNPCISANGENICLALDMGYRRCAANFVDFGVRLFIQGVGECLVTDRMNSRYKNSVDIAMRLDEKERALKFGRQRLNVKILERVY